MELRRIFYQLGALAGCVAFGLTLWFAMAKHQLDFFQASLRAVGVGIAIMVLSLLLTGIIEKLGGPTEEEHPKDEIESTEEQQTKDE